MAELYYLDAARHDDQVERMREHEAAGRCVFCPEHVATYQTNPIEFAGRYWYYKRNDWPYAGTVAHYLIVPLEHIVAFDELPNEAGAELWAIKRHLKAQLEPLATATVERSGDIRLNGGSVAHLHVHFVALARDPAKTVRFRVSARGAQD